VRKEVTNDTERVPDDAREEEAVFSPQIHCFHITI